MRTPLTCPIPGTINPLFASNFIFSVNKLPDLTFFVQDVSLPDISLGQANYSTRLSDIPVPGDKLNFGTLSVSFQIDESYKNFKALTEWIMALGFPESNSQYTNFIDQQEVHLSEHLKTVSDATLGILDSEMQPIAIYTFVDCFPISVSGFEVTSQTTDSNPLKATAVFAFNYFSLDTN